MTKLIQQFAAARRAGTPLIAIRSLDYDATMQSIQLSLNGTAAPIIQFDSVRGMKSRNDSGQKALDKALEGATNPINPIDMLVIAENLPFDAQATKPVNPILFILNAHHYLDRSYAMRSDFIQALWNLRIPYRDSLRTVVLLAPDFSFPQELQHDILILDEPLPTEDELTKIVTDTTTAFGTTLTADTTAHAVDALRGLVAFEAEQATAMSLSKKGLDVDELWQRKKQMVSETEALSIYSGKEKFSDVGGCTQVKKFLTGVINGKDAPKVIVFIDEGEKMFSGASGDVQDSSGTSQDSLATTLKYMEDNEADGAIFVGPPGAAKSLIAKAAGNEAGIPTIILDTGAAKGSLVGESEMKIRNAYKIIDAVGGGRVYFIMTTNKAANLPPELKRRFTSGTFYFEIPDAFSSYQERTERDLIWPIFIKKYELDAAQIADVDDSGWTGAEIRNCCRLAYRLQIPLVEAAEYIIPVSKSAKAQIESLRKEASGKYLCANQPGIYEYTAGQKAHPTATIASKRMFATGGE